MYYSLASSLVVGATTTTIAFLSTCVVAAPPLNSRSGLFEKRDLDSWIASERTISLQSALNNIGPNGSQVPGAGAGFVVASPSKADPDYFYTWTRDSALTLKMIIDEYTFGDTALLQYIEDYIHAQAVLQTVTNPSGTFLPSGLGLGEPKYQVDGSRFNGAWGRPQRDGPALRATALMTYSNYLIMNGQSEYVKTVIWPIISNDLSYVGQYWNQTGFDLWEEINGSSFFTLQNQHRALVEGTQLAKTLDVTCTGCDQAPSVLCFLQSFWNGEYLVANINVEDGRTGIDGNTILGPIQIFDIGAYCDNPTFQPCHSKSLANFKVLIDTMRETYAINDGIAKNQGVAVGRYAEDVYMGGNPWYLITLAAAEFLYDAVAQWKAQDNLNIDNTSLPFFQDLYPNATIQSYNTENNSSTFSEIMDAVTAYADSFVIVAQNYTPSSGALAEQFSRQNGTALSARDLTWSYASFVTMAQRRSGLYPETWNSKNIDNSTTTTTMSCEASSTTGIYVPAVAAGAPNISESCTVMVTFLVNASTYYGENVYLVGNTTDLGSWDLGISQPMNAGNYTAARPLWYASLQMIAGETVNYKYVREEDCDQAPIYESVNRTLTVPACGSTGITTDDAWTGDVGTSGGC